MKIKILLKIALASLLACIFLTTKVSAATTPWQDATTQNNGAKVRVLSSYYTDENQQQNLILGLHFNIENGWHVYGNESGGIGMPPSVDFTGSSNYIKHQISWPQAINKEEKIGKEILKYSVYENEVILPVEVSLKDIAQPTQLKLKLNYGLCKDVCIPASTDFVVDVVVQEDVKILELIQKFFNKQIVFANSAAPKSETATQSESVQNSAASTQETSITLLSALLAAALGGLILNVMPCVLPVLGIKLMSIIKHQESNISHIRFSFLATILGIISCFVIFAIFAVIIKFTGNIFNWGLQFQNPYFLILLIIVLLGFVANMLDMFEISSGQIITNLINKKISEKEESKNIFLSNFLSGVLAVLLATPCSAPFLGSAISFSITQNSSIIFLIFIAMGLGLALPYIILIISPKLVYLLPKPGDWMVRIRQLMAILLISTVIWLIYVLSNNIGAAAGGVATVASLLFFACFKIKIKSLKILAITLLTITLLILPATFQNTKKSPHPADMMWIKFDEEALYKFVATGQTVVVDVTADWCITCKFNKLRVFHDEEVVQKLKVDNIIKMRADITNPDEAVLTFIHKKGRYAIPFNAVYGPNAVQGLLTNELLSKKELFQLIDQASNKQ